MSEADVRACVERMKTDQVFSDGVRAAADLAARTRLINAEGFACTMEEVEAMFAELSDADLDRVAGGMGINRIVVTDGRINR